MSLYNTETVRKRKRRTEREENRAEMLTFIFGSGKRRKRSSAKDGEKTYYGILIVAVVLFSLLAFTAGMVAYKKTIDGISLESEAAAKKERETIWIDAKPDITAPAAQVIAEPEPLDEKDIPKVNADGEPYYDIPLSEERQDTVIYFCKEYGVPVELVYGIMWVGSGFDEGLISETGDYGIMQINESNFEQLTNDLGATDYLDFSQNVHCGVHMLAGYYHKYSDFSKTAMCYRYGETSAKRMWEQGVEDTDYTKKLVRALSTIKER